jgi:hypothetical protein
MGNNKPNPAYFEYRAILEDLENLDELEPAHAMKLQTRLCELKLEIAEHEKNLTEQQKKVFRKNAIPKNKHNFPAELSDYMAFKHLLSNREFTRKHPAGTLRSWLHRLNNGELPTITEELLKANGYKVIQPRKWAKPNSIKHKNK